MKETIGKIDVATLTSRGQIVIPQDIREERHLRKGDKFLVVSAGKRIIFEQLKELEKKKDIYEIEEEIELMKEAEKGWEEIKKGQKKTYKNEKEFLKDLAKW